MDNSYAYEEDEYEEGLTLKKVGHFLAKGWVRMLVYALIAVLVTAIVVLPIKVFYKSEPVAQTSIEFIYKGVEEGLDPNGGTLNTDNIISPAVLGSAVESAELTEVLTDISKLRGAMRVEAVPTQEYLDLRQAAADGNADAQKELLTYKMFPTRFNIVLSDPKKLGLNDTQAALLLDKVVAAYFDSFRDRYSVSKPFSSDIFTLSTDKTIEFTKVYDVYEATLSSAREALDLLAKSGGTFESKAKVTFSALQGRLSTLELSYDNFNDYILDNNIWRNKSTATKTFNDEATRLTAEKTAQEAYITSLQAQIKEIKANTVTSTNGGQTVETQSYPEQYYEYQDLLVSAQNALRSIETRIANNTIRSNTIATAPDVTSSELIASAESAVAGLEKSSAEFIDSLNVTISEYYDATVVSSAVRQVQPSSVTRRSSGLNVLIILLIAAAVGLVVGGIVTGVKIFKANAAQAEKESVETEVKEETPEPEAEEEPKKTTKNKKQ